MIVFRRVLAVLLGIIFVFATIASAFALRVKDTALNDKFYVSQLREADVYNFFYDSVVPLIIDELSKQDLGGNKIDLATAKTQAVAAVKQAIPPLWLQQQTESIIHEVVPYATGRTDEFVVQVPVAERLKAASEALKKAIHDSKFVDLLFDDVIAPQVREALKDPNAIPFGISLSADDLVARMRRVLPNEWLETQIFKAIDAIVPYLTGEKDSFSIQIPLADRAEAARTEIKGILQKANLRDFIFKNVIDPTVQAQVGNNLSVPFGLKVTSADVQGVLRQVLTDAWFNRQTDVFVDATVDYVSGKTQAFSIAVPLSDLKGQVALGVASLMDTKLSAQYNQAPPCTNDQLRTLDYQQIARSGIPCRPVGVSFADVKTLAGIADYQKAVADVVNASLPAVFTLNEASLRTSLGEAQWSKLQDLRKWTAQGYSFSTADLEKTLAKGDYPSSASVPFDKLQPAAQAQFISQSSNVKTLHDIRDQIKKGVVFTQADLEKRMNESEAGSFEKLERARDMVGLAMRLSILLWIIPAVMLIGVALLGGRSIPTKIIWGGAFLLFAAVFLFIAGGPAYNAASGDIHADIQQAFSTTGSPLEQALAHKGEQIATNMADEFFAGIARRGLALMVISIIAIGGAVAWTVMEKRREGAPAGRPAEPA